MVKTLSRTIADDTNELPGDAPKPITRKPGFRTQKEAKDAGLFELGEFARHGFEYETYKCDGRWLWRKHDEVKPPTAADLKASGGKKGPKAEAIARRTKAEDIAHAKAAIAPIIPAIAAVLRSDIEQAKHEQRGAERARAEGRLRPRRAADASDATEASPAAPATENASGTSYGAGQPPMGGDKNPSWTSPDGMNIDSRSIPAGATIIGPGATIIGPTTADTVDGLAIPDFLMRPKPTAAETEAVRKKLAKVVGPERVIKNPPDAKVAKAKAKKRAAGSKTALIGSMLLDSKGCTTAEVLKATGWPAVGMPAQAKACGLKLRKEKDGKVTRYFGSK